MILPFYFNEYRKSSRWVNYGTLKGGVEVVGVVKDPPIVATTVASIPIAVATTVGGYGISSMVSKYVV